MTRPVSRIGRRHSEQRLAAIFDQIMQGGPVDDDPRDYTPDGHSQAEIDRRGDEAADLDYDRRMR